MINVTLYPLLHNGMLIIEIDRMNAIHIHHWVFYTVVLLLIWRSCARWITAFMMGLVLQGLTYGDRFEFLVPNPYTNS